MKVCSIVGARPRFIKVATVSRIFARGWRKGNSDPYRVQKVPYFLGKPCVTMRDETEWIEFVENRVSALAGADSNAIGAALQRDWSWCNVHLLYGNRDAAQRIAATLLGIKR